MKEYQEVLQDILDNGREKESGRENMPNTIGLSHATILMKDVAQNFPLLTTKKMYWKGIVCELLWFLRGETNIKYLVDNNVNIWNGDAYRWYLKKCKDNNIKPYFETQDDFVQAIKNLRGIYFDSMNNLMYDPQDEFVNHLGQLSQYKLGDLGKVYGHQWRNQNGVDQVQDVFNDLKNNPYGRYKIIDGWNKRDFPEMALPPCHLLYQFIVRPMTFEERSDWASWEFDDLKTWTVDELDERNVPKYYLDLNMYQRSVDTPLGCPFNLASMSLLLIIMAKAVGMVAGDAFWIGGDTHIYVNQIDGVKEQLKRKPMQLPKVIITRKIETMADICNLTTNDIILKDYESHPKIDYTLSVGL